MKVSREFQSEDEYLVTHLVDRYQTGVRLDAFLKDRYRKRSRAAMVRAIESGVITVRRAQSPHLTVGRLKASTQLIAGDEVRVLSERKPEPPVSFDYKVVYEDDELFVVDKPANLPVHPAGRYFFNTLLTHLMADGRQTYYLAHRLDKETSGILAMTKTKEACADLTAQFASRTTGKTYLAIARGAAPARFTVDAAMARARNSVIELKMAIVPEGDPEAQAARTDFEALGSYGDFSLVRCTPKTGRQHQIRLHLEHAGHPIVGDKLYGLDETQALRFYERQHLSEEAMAAMLLPRHALHAHALEIEHPRTGEALRFESPLPRDLQDFLDRQALRASPAPRPTARPAGTTTGPDVFLARRP